jgi:hypothetical protein
VSIPVPAADGNETAVATVGLMVPPLKIGEWTTACELLLWLVAVSIPLPAADGNETFEATVALTVPPLKMGE